MSSPEVQGSRAVVVWIDSETAEEFVPLSVAEKLAAALEGIKNAERIEEMPSAHRDAMEALYQYRREHPHPRPAGEHREEGQP